MDCQATSQTGTNDPGHSQTVAGVLQSGQPGRRCAVGRISPDGSSWDGPRSQESQHLWSLGAVRNQHGTCTVATGSGWQGGAKPLRSMPLWLPMVRADARLAALAPGQCSPAGRLVGALRTIPAMAMSQGPVCEVRLLVVHRYPPGVQKLGTAPCEVEFFGRRGGVPPIPWTPIRGSQV
jgi:hypothetical protein